MDFGWKNGLVPGFALEVWGSAVLMWSWSDLMTITVVRFWLCCFQFPVLYKKYIPHHVLITVISQTNHMVSSHCRATGHLDGSYADLSVHLLVICLYFGLLSVPWCWGQKVSGLRAVHWDSQDIQSTREFINTDFEPCLPGSIRVTSPGPAMPNTVSYFSARLSPVLACPHHHPSPSVRSATSASPLPLWYPNNIQHSSGLAAFLDSSSPERGLTEIKEPQEKEKKKNSEL